MCTQSHSHEIASSQVENEMLVWVWHLHYAHTCFWGLSLIPRLLPFFLHAENGGAWYLIAHDLRERECPTV